MLTQKDKKKIRSKLNSIYKKVLSKRDIDNCENNIIEIINNFNKKKIKIEKKISEKTSLIICYGDNIYLNKKKSINVFETFFKKKLEKYFNIIHFLPFWVHF